MQNPDRRNPDKRIIIVKNWQIILSVIILVSQIIFSYATRAANSDNNTREIRELKERHNVEWDVYTNEQAALKDQLNRVEGKLDNVLENRAHK